MATAKNGRTVEYSRLVWVYAFEGFYPRSYLQLKEITGISERAFYENIGGWDVEREQIARERFMDSELISSEGLIRQKHAKHILCIEKQMEAIEVRLDMLDVEDKEYWSLSSKYSKLKEEWERDTGIVGTKEGSATVEKVKVLHEYQKESSIPMLPQPEALPLPEPRKAKGRVVGSEFNV